MKKIILCVLCSIFLFGLQRVEAAPTITLTSPNGGETLKEGDTYRITWDATNVDKVTMGYSYGPGSLNWFTNNSANNIPNVGYYDWKVYAYHMSTTTEKLKISIIGYQTGVGSASDQSDDYFTVVHPQVTQNTTPVVVPPAVPPTPTVPPTTLPQYVPETLTVSIPEGMSFSNGTSFQVNWTQPKGDFDQYFLGWGNRMLPGSLSADTMEGMNTSKTLTSKNVTAICSRIDGLYNAAQISGIKTTKEAIANNFFIQVYAEKRISPVSVRTVATGDSKTFAINCNPVPVITPVSTPTAPAQVTAFPADIDDRTTSSCVELTQSLRYRDTDASTRQSVSLLQDFLQSKGYFDQEPTGFFGQMTVAAVKRFQLASSIQPTGFVGELTRKAVQRASCSTTVVAVSGSTPTASVTQTAPTISAPIEIPANFVFTRDLALGSAGSDVLVLQSYFVKKGFLAKENITGSFDEATKTALTKYQQSVGIQAAVGVFGPLTRASLNRDISVGR
ncbi:MAG: hypothetical protein RL094_723 [Candidatus Parcubacteria bacterium]|jgi:peptidoglycan hydrolase-like protein with peptidoglycan-binding domain